MKLTSIAFRPLLLGRLERDGAAAAGGIRQNVDAPESLPGRLRELLAGAFLIEVGLDHEGLGAACRDDLGCELLEQGSAARRDGELDAFAREAEGDGAAYAA
jgi:hypothetical protein